jgi:hypothetical protein
MRKRYQILGFTALLLAAAGIALGQSPETMIDDAILEVAVNSSQSERIAQKTAEKLRSIKPQAASSALYAAFSRPITAQRQQQTVLEIIEKLPNFDFEDWVAHLEKEPDPMLLSFGMSACSIGRDTLPPVLKSFLQSKLSDRRVGQKLDGEARAYASEGLRVCDRALHELWSFEPEDTRPARYSTFSAATSVKERDQLIADYVKKFGVTSVNLSEDPSKARRIGPPASLRKGSGSMDSAPPIASTVPSPEQANPVRSGSYLGISLSLAILAGLAAWLLVRARREKD